MIIIDWCQSNHNKKFDIIAESIPHLDDGAIKDFTSIMVDRGYWKDNLWNKTLRIYTFETGTILKFKSVDKLGKAHGPRRDGLFINEANNIPYNIYDQLEVRTKEVVWLDWNPSTEFWYYTEVKGRVDHNFITLTYLDCLEVLDQRIIDAIESRKGNLNWWKVYGLGQLGEVEGRVYKGWQIIEEIPYEARLVSRGLDFGFSQDPAVLLDIYQYNGGFIVDEVFHQLGLHNRQIAEVMLAKNNHVMTYADAAEPKSIDEIHSYGGNIMGATKGQGSVRQGIDFLQAQKMSITKRSVNTIRSYRNYMFKTDRDGKILTEPDHAFSDPMDALRYAMTPFRVNYEARPKVIKGGYRYKDPLRNSVLF